MSLLKILAIVAVIVAVAIAIIYVMGMFEQTKPIADAATGLGAQATDYVQKNIPTVTAYAGTVSAAIGTVLVYKKQASDKVTAITTSTNTQIDGLLSEKDKITTQFDNAKSELENTTKTLTDTQTQFENYKVETEPLRNQVTSLQDQVQSAKDENAQFVMSLMSAANGALVSNPVDGKVYSVLKTPPEIHVK